MSEYYLTLAGLRTVLRTPKEITISENLRPFLCSPQENFDCTIALQLCDHLPAFSDGIWNGPEFYDRHDGALRNFHCDAKNGAAFAVTQLFDNGNIQIRILPEYLHYFSGSAGIFNRIGMETLLLQHFGLLLHASLIKLDGKAIAFAGPSGIGKSTQADLWQQYFGAQIVNGDRAVLRKTADGWMAYGSPYAGTSGIYKNDSAPLSAIVFLSQATENRLQQLTSADAFRHLYPELSIHHWDKQFVAQATDIALSLLSEIPVYWLECRPDQSAAALTKKGLML
jgi:hypothetical protein